MTGHLDVFAKTTREHAVQSGNMVMGKLENAVLIVGMYADGKVVFVQPYNGNMGNKEQIAADAAKTMELAHVNRVAFIPSYFYFNGGP